jgi:hypothetical protein
MMLPVDWAMTTTLIADEPDEQQILILCVICFIVLTGPLIGIQTARKAISDANEQFGGGYDLNASEAEKNRYRRMQKELKSPPKKKGGFFGR